MTLLRIATRAEFERTVRQGITAESKHLEFKGNYGWRTDNRGEQAVELCRDVAQFANSDGGVLLIGVTEMAGSGGQKVAGAIRAIDDVDGLRNWIEQAIRTYLTPSTFTRSVIAVETAEGTILAVDIRPSLHLVALWHKQHRAGIEYLYRTDHGKQWMNPDEVERHLMNASRAARLAVQEVKQKVQTPGPVELVPAIGAIGHDGNGALLMIAEGMRPTLRDCGERSVGLTVFTDDSGETLEIPYGVIRDAWVTTDGRPGLCLSVRLIRRANGKITMEPLEQSFPAVE